MGQKLIYLFLSICVSIIVLGYFLFQLGIPNELFTIYFIIFLGSVGYIVVYVIHMTARYYYDLKSCVYEQPLEKIQEKLIARYEKSLHDYAGFVALSMLINLVLFVLFTVSSITKVLETQAFVQFFNLPFESNEKLFSGIFLTLEETVVLLIMIFFGPTYLFLLRQFHHKLTRCVNIPRYPGSRPLLLYFYIISLIYVGNLVIEYILDILEIQEPSTVNINYDAFILLTIFSLIISSTTWVGDRKLFS